MKGWVTTDVKQVIGIVKKHGFSKVLDERDLVVEMETEDDYHRLNRDLRDHFQDQVHPEKL